MLESAFGVTLLNSVDAYREADRALKYGVLFIALTFAACLLFEFVGGTRPLGRAYGLIGLSLCVFYLLLLSLAEQIGFGPAYLVSAVGRGGAGSDLQLGAAAIATGPPWPLAPSWPGSMAGLRLVAARGRGVAGGLVAAVRRAVAGHVVHAQSASHPACLSRESLPFTSPAGMMRPPRPFRSADAFCLFACLLVFAAGPAFGQKQVNVYNWSDYIAEDPLKVFSKETGIKVNYDVYDSNEVLEAKLLAGRSGYDVVVPSASPYLARQLRPGSTSRSTRPSSRITAISTPRSWPRSPIPIPATARRAVYVGHDRHRLQRRASRSAGQRADRFAALIFDPAK